MDCKKASDIMMDYFDSPLDSNPHKLNKLCRHLQECDGCRADFNAYDELMTNILPVDEIVETPADIEALVMARILSFDMETEKKHVTKEAVMFTLWGAASALIGLYFAYGLTNETVQAVLAQFNIMASDAAALLNQYQYIFILFAVGLVIVRSRFAEMIGARKNDD